MGFFYLTFVTRRGGPLRWLKVMRRISLLLFLLPKAANSM
jgi:hypothetical protein